jgi:membrane-associated HD superfamily phosphohydrolase
MTLLELQDVLGDRIKVALKENMTPEQRQTENEQSALIVGLAKQMINNGDLILRTEKLAAQTKSLSESAAMKLITGRLIDEQKKVESAIENVVEK